MDMSLKGKVALVAGATRGAGRGIAVELGAAGATVYVTGRTTREQQSEYARPETIEETAELVSAPAARASPSRVDHLVADEVGRLVDRIRAEQGRLDVLVNDIWGGEKLFEWNKPVWEHNLDNGLRMLRLGIDTHLITAHHALPLLIERPGGLLVEVTDGTAEYNADHYRIYPFYDLAKVAVTRMAWAHAKDLAPHGATAVSITPGWLRSEMMLEAFGVTEANWRDATPRVPHFVISETPRFVGRAVAALAADPDRARWNGQSLSSGGLAQVYGFTDLDGSRPDAWRYIREVQDAGKPADAIHVLLQRDRGQQGHRQGRHGTGRKNGAFRSSTAFWSSSQPCMPATAWLHSSSPRSRRIWPRMAAGSDCSSRIWRSTVTVWSGNAAPARRCAPAGERGVRER